MSEEYNPELWVPRPTPVNVLKIELENLEAIKRLLGATKADVAYNRGGTILIEWTLAHRGSFAGLVGQYILRDGTGEFKVMDSSELRASYLPYIEEKVQSTINLSHPDLGRLVGFNKENGIITGVVFELPDGSPASFVLDSLAKSITEKAPEKDKQIMEEKTLEKPHPSPANIPKKRPVEG